MNVWRQCWLPLKELFKKWIKLFTNETKLFTNGTKRYENEIKLFKNKTKPSNSCKVDCWTDDIPAFLARQEWQADMVTPVCTKILTTNTKSFRDTVRKCKILKKITKVIWTK